MRRFFYILFTVTLIGCSQEEICIDADLVLNNSKIYTADDSNTVAESVAIKNGSIVFVGSNKEIEPYKCNAKVIDLSNAFVYPGFIDSHVHLKATGYPIDFNQALIAAMSDDSIDGTSLELVHDKVIKSSNDQRISMAFCSEMSFDNGRFTHLCILPQIPSLRFRRNGHAFYHSQPITLNTFNPIRRVGDQSQLSHPTIQQYLSADSEFAQIFW